MMIPLASVNSVRPSLQRFGSQQPLKSEILDILGSRYMSTASNYLFLEGKPDEGAKERDAAVELSEGVIEHPKLYDLPEPRLNLVGWLLRRADVVDTLKVPANLPVRNSLNLLKLAKDLRTLALKLTDLNNKLDEPA